MKRRSAATIPAIVAILTCTVLGAAAPCARAQDNPRVIEFGKFELVAPEGWERKQPRTRIVEYEFAIPPAEDDKGPGRMTLMSAGGGIEANIDRWYGQFTQPDGGSTRQRAKVEKLKVGDQEVHVVDLSGTYKDQAGPQAPATDQPDYRMLAAIFPSDAGTYYLKFYGPSKTVAAQEAAFRAMVAGLKRK